jgi:hypothetical protein
MERSELGLFVCLGFIKSYYVLTIWETISISRKTLHREGKSGTFFFVLMKYLYEELSVFHERRFTVEANRVVLFVLMKYLYEELSVFHERRFTVEANQLTV